MWNESVCALSNPSIRMRGSAARTGEATMFGTVFAALLAVSPAPAPDTDCAARLQRHLASDLTLSYTEFDQTMNAGFRVLAPDCPGEAADLIEAYIAKNATVENSLVWHIAQLRATAGETEAALVAARRSIITPEKAAATKLRWNDYVLATIAFLEQDRAAFDSHRDAVAAGIDEHAGNGMNLALLDRMGAKFHASYDDIMSGR
jgi:hypothetical protein